MPHGGGGKGSSRGNPLTNPNATLSGHALMHAAKALTRAQIHGPISELAHQIVVGNRQGAGAQAKTAGYFANLGNYAHQGFQDVSLAASNLNDQLAGIGQHTQNTLQDVGQNAQNSLSKYTPGLQQGNPGTASLAQAIAQQQGLASQSSGAFQAAGATQGANQRGLAGTNEGVYGLMGQERLGQIGQATALANEPLNAKIAALRETGGAALAKNLGALRQQEITNTITQQGLGLKQQTLAATVANDKARIQATIRGQNVSLTEAQARNRIAQINAKIASGRLSETQRHNLATEKTALQRAQRTSGSGGGSSPLTTNEQNKVYDQIDNIQSLIKQARAQGHAGNSIRQALQTGTYAPGTPKYPSLYVEAAYELLGWGHILPKTAAALHAQGLRGSRYRVAPAPGSTGPSLGHQQGLGATTGLAG